MSLCFCLSGPFGRESDVAQHIEKIGLDLGAATLQVCTASERSREIPAWIWQDARKDRLWLVGQEALAKKDDIHANGMMARPFSTIAAISPRVLSAVIRHLIDAVERPGTLFRPALYLAVRDSMAGVEKKVLSEAAMAAGARKVEMVSSSALAYAIAKKDIFAVTYYFMVDIGATKSDVILRNEDGVLRIQTIPLGGWDFDRLIIEGLMRDYGIWISGEAAEKLKETKMNSTEVASQLLMVYGRSITDGTTRRVTIESALLWAWLEPAIDDMAEQLVRFLMQGSEGEKISLSESGLVLYGGGANMAGLAAYLAKHIGLKVCVAEHARAYTMKGLQKYFAKD